nr:hypothetical protein [uncultured bacterium]
MLNRADINQETIGDRWRQLKRFRVISLASLLVFLVTPFLTFVLKDYAPDIMLTVRNLICVTSILVFGLFYLAALLWECPRCGKNYHMNYPHSFFPIRQDCAHCGLAFGEENIGSA